MGCCNPSKEEEQGGKAGQKKGKQRGTVGQAVDEYASEGFTSGKTMKTVASFGVSSKSKSFWSSAEPSAQNTMDTSTIKRDIDEPGIPIRKESENTDNGVMANEDSFTKLKVAEG